MSPPKKTHQSQVAQTEFRVYCRAARACGHFPFSFKRVALTPETKAIGREWEREIDKCGARRGFETFVCKTDFRHTRGSTHVKRASGSDYLFSAFLASLSLGRLLTFSGLENSRAQKENSDASPLFYMAALFKLKACILNRKGLCAMCPLKSRFNGYESQGQF